MNVLHYCNYNGDLVPEDSIRIPLSNRAFKYGDGVFETIRCMGSRIQLLDYHYERLMNALDSIEILKNKFPSKDQLQSQIEKLTIKNKFFISSRVRLSVFRNDGGLYTPTNNGCSYVIEIQPLNSSSYELNEKGLIADIFQNILKPINCLSAFKTANALLYIKAGLFKQKNQLGECFIVNENNKLIEALSSNLWWMKNDVFYTPALTTGCVEGIMRRHLITLIETNEMQHKEINGANLNDIETAEELFVSNAIQGIQWIVGFNDLRYFNQKTKKLHLLLNASIS